jgi:hypothetical protein
MTQAKAPPQRQLRARIWIRRNGSKGFEQMPNHKTFTSLRDLKENVARKLQPYSKYLLGPNNVCVQRHGDDNFILNEEDFVDDCL